MNCFVLIPCIIEYVENDQQNVLYYIFLFHVVPAKDFGNNYAIFREQLSSFSDVNLGRRQAT
jgi:hypothetical protein